MNKHLGKYKEVKVTYESVIFFKLIILQKLCVTSLSYPILQSILILSLCILRLSRVLLIWQ